MPSLAPASVSSQPCTDVFFTKCTVCSVPSAAVTTTVFVPASTFFTVPSTAVTTSSAANIARAAKLIPRSAFFIMILFLPDSDPPRQQDGHVVLELVGRGPIADTLHHHLDDLFIVQMCIARDQIDQPVFAEHLAVFVLRLGNAVGKAHQKVA